MLFSNFLIYTFEDRCRETQKNMAVLKELPSP